MSDVYRLVFRGEVLEGQHPAVVRKRLGSAADLDAATLDRLFSGRAVVLKREADSATAARLQVMFRKAGARLRVLRVEAQGEPGHETVQAAAPAPPDNDPAADFELLPPGSDVLRADERTVWEGRDIDTGALSIEAPDYRPPADTGKPPAAPDVSHLKVAEAGAVLGSPRQSPQNAVQPPDLKVAAVGERLGPSRGVPPSPVDFAKLVFEVAPTGVNLDQRCAPATPAAPDTSHLRLEEEGRARARQPPDG